MPAHRALRGCALAAALALAALASGCAAIDDTPAANEPRPPGASPAKPPDFYASLPRRARAEAVKARQRALESRRSGEALQWRRGDHSGTITPERTYRTAAGTYCRQFLELLSALPRARRATACRSRDAVWQIVEPDR